MGNYKANTAAIFTTAGITPKHLSCYDQTNEE
jgi:hypothetical protein